MKLDSFSNKPRRYLMIMLLLLAGLWAGVHFFGHSKPDPSQRAAVVTTGSIEEVVTAQGKLEPKEYVDVGAQVSGQLKKLMVDLGQAVKQGDQIAEIDPEIYKTEVEGFQAALKTLEAQRQQQQAQGTLARQVLKRNQALIASKAVSQETLEESISSAKVAEAQLKSLNAQIEEARSTLEGGKTKLNYTKIYAPISGTVVSQTAREGATLNANQTTPIIVQVANLDVMTVRAQVAEADIPKLKEGMTVYFTTLGGNGRKWESTVRQILPTPEIINDVVLFDVLVDVDNKDHQLMSSMSTQMFFVLGRARDIPVIPVSALGKRLPEADSDAGQAYQVRVIDGGSMSEKTVHIGLMDRSHAEVKDGLEVGDRVAVNIVTIPKPDAQPRRGMPRI